MPNPMIWKPNEVMVRTLSRVYTMDQMEDFFKYVVPKLFSKSNDLNLLFRDINFNDGWEMRKDSLPYAMNFTAPGVEIYCLYGTGIDTVEK